jgi:uncharacterized protein (DUF111 family)
MKLIIDPRGGMAGDMFTAALVSAGADFAPIRDAMQTAGRKLGSTEIILKQANDGASQLDIKLHSHRHHLGGNEAREILHDLFHQFQVREKYSRLGMNILDILVKAEIKAHKEFNIVIDDHSHHHSHAHLHEHSHEHSHAHPHDESHHHTNHHHPHRHHLEPEESFLHEAQDIIIDIIGAVTGMQQLDIETSAELCAPVSVGGGFVTCSHGRLSIPAPATTVILRESDIPWKKGPVDIELFTPTGAAILSALGSPLNPSLHPEKMEIKTSGTARGTKILDIPPLKFYLTYNSHEKS